MVKQISEDELLLMPESAAVDHHFMAGNYSVYKWMISILFFISLLSLPFSYRDLFNLNGIPIWIGLSGWGILWWERNRDFTKRNIYLLLKISIIFTYLYLISEDLRIWEEPGTLRISIAFILPWILIFLRLRYSDSISLVLIFFIFNVFDMLFPYHPKSFLRIFILFIVYSFILSITLALTKRKKTVFLKRWRQDVRKNRERLRMKQELEKAKEIQLEMLPKFLPTTERYDLAGRSIPAMEVGGDYYDLFKKEDDRGFTLVVGDVSGHGLGSGLVLSGVRAGLNLLMDEDLSPRQILNRLNRMMKRTTDKKTFMTMVCTRFNLSDKMMDMVLSNAGHLPIIHYQQKSARFDEIRHPALPLGNRLDMQYKEIRVPLSSGDTLIFYSDGISEARNMDGEEFGDRQFKELLARVIPGDLDANGILEALLHDLYEFSGSTVQQDDATLVIVKIR